MSARATGASFPSMTTSHDVPARSTRPLSLIAFLVVLGALANALLIGCGGSKSESTSQQSATDTPPAETSARPAMGSGAGDDSVSAEIAAGMEIYVQSCSLCHGKEGKGDGPGAAGLNPKPRNHTDGTYMNDRSNAELIDVIENGKGQMPAWGKGGVLDKNQIRHVIAYLRTLATPKYTGPMP